MKKNIYLLLALLLFLASCGEEMEYSLDDYNTKKKTQVVTIQIQGIDKTVNNLRSTTSEPSSLADAGIRHLHYIVEGAFTDYKKVVYFKGDEVPATITDTLPEGIYIVSIIAATNDKGAASDHIPYQYITEEGTNMPMNNILIQGSLPTAEIFYKQFDLEVNTSTAIDQIVLKRIVTKINIVPTDLENIPEDLSWIQFLFENTEYQVYGGWIYSSNWYNKIAATAAYTRNDLLAINESNPISFNSLPIASMKEPVYPVTGHYPLIVIKHYNDGTEIRQVIKSEYNWSSNTVYELSGMLFNQSVDPGGVIIEKEWDNNVIEDNFD